MKWLRIGLIEAAHAADRPKPPSRPGTQSWSSPGTSYRPGETYTDLGGDYFDKQRTSTAHLKPLIAQLEAIGYEVTVTPKAA